MKGFLRSACRFFVGAFLVAALVPLVAVDDEAFAETSSVTPSSSSVATLAATGYDHTQTTTDATGLGLSVSWNTPKGGAPTVFHLQGRGGLGKYKYYYNTVQLDDPGYMTADARVIDPSRTAYQDSPDIPFTFYVSGTYDFFFYVMDMGTNTTKRIQVKVTVSDPAYPSVPAIVAKVKTECLAAGNTTDYEKALWLHDWLLDNCTYDNSLLYCGAEGALARGTGTCESYHKAYVLLLNAVGIETKRIEGNGHVWTGVKLDGKWCHVDATWDDASQWSGYPDNRHLYFGMDDKLAGFAHSDYLKAEQIGATSLDLNYFIKTGEIKKWSQPYVADILSNLESGKTSFTVNINHSSWPESYSNNFYTVIAYDLSQREWVYSDGSKRASVKVTYANNALQVERTQLAVIDKTVPLQVINSEPVSRGVLVHTGALQKGVVVPDGAPYTLSGVVWASAAGNYTVVATPQVGYAWNAAGDVSPREYSWSISRRSLTSSEVSISGLGQFVETGSAITPKVVVKHGIRTLAEGTDYSLSYSNNTKPGTATVTIVGKGSYEDSKTASFAIVAKPVVSQGSGGSSSSSGSSGFSHSGSNASSSNNVSAPKPAPKPTGTWIASGGRWWYSHFDGSYMRNGWELIDGLWYYFDGAGWMRTGWLKLGGTWYYLHGSGAMAEGWQRIGGTWYYLHPGSGAMATGWVNDNGTWYYHYGSGAMATGWVRVGGVWYYLYGSGAMAENTWVGNCYLTASGAMATNTWIGSYHVNGSGLWDATR